MLNLRSSPPPALGAALLVAACHAAAPASEPNAATAPAIQLDTGAPARPSDPYTLREPILAGPGDPSVAVVFDGDTREWPEGQLATHDRRYLYLRFAPAGPPWTLQAGPVSTVISLDVDADASTGRALRDDGHAPLGVDLEIQLSPSDAALAPGRGVLVTSYDASGRARSSTHAEVGFSFAPTYAAASYEARVRRTPSAALPRGITGPVRALLSTRGRAAKTRALHEHVSLDVGGVGPRRADAGLPGATESGLRVMSYNVLRASPRADPRPFARTLAALQPDVLLAQEWDGFDARALHKWFAQNLGPSRRTGDWYTHSDPDRGLALISAYPIERPLDLGIPRGEANGRPRFVAAIIRTPLGRGLFASVHLKCCGTLGSPEDEQRVAQARSIYARARALEREHNLDFVVLGGDLNLVGSRAPLDALIGGAQAGDRGLRPAAPQVLGDGGCHTWRGDADSPFSPGRLDFIAGSARALSETRAFALDSAELSPETLRAYGLDARDTDASDHLPIVVEFARRGT